MWSQKAKTYRRFLKKRLGKITKQSFRIKGVRESAKQHTKRQARRDFRLLWNLKHGNETNQRRVAKRLVWARQAEGDYKMRLGFDTHWDPTFHKVARMTHPKGLLRKWAPDKKTLYRSPSPTPNPKKLRKLGLTIGDYDGYLRPARAHTQSWSYSKKMANRAKSWHPDELQKPVVTRRYKGWRPGWDVRKALGKKTFSPEEQEVVLTNFKTRSRILRRLPVRKLLGKGRR